MKSFTVFCVLAVVASVTCVPVSKKPEDDEVMIIPIPSAHPAVFDMDDGIVDTGYNGGYFSSYNPFAFSFTGLMQTMEGLMRQLREQATELQNLRPSVDWKDIGADGKGNTTSTTKVINGHKVTINETTYANQGENTGSVFKIRIVDVHPTDEEDTSLSTDNKSGEKPVGESKEVEETTPKNIKTDNESGSPELVEETANEIPHEKSEMKSERKSWAESLEEDLSGEIFPEASLQQVYAAAPSGLESFESMEPLDDAFPVREIETNDVNFEPIDLSNDIYVNQMLADAGAPHNPDAEIFTVDGGNELPNYPKHFYQIY